MTSGQANWLAIYWLPAVTCHEGRQCCPIPILFMSNKREDAVDLKDRTYACGYFRKALWGLVRVPSWGCCAAGTGWTSKRLVLGYTSLQSLSWFITCIFFLFLITKVLLLCLSWHIGPSSSFWYTNAVCLYNQLFRPSFFEIQNILHLFSTRTFFFLRAGQFESVPSGTPSGTTREAQCTASNKEENSLEMTDVRVMANLWGPRVTANSLMGVCSWAVL